MATQSNGTRALPGSINTPVVPGCACDHLSAGPGEEALQRFDDAYLLWKAVTVRYEHEMLLMNTGDAQAYSRIVVLVQDMAHAHHEFLKASQPLFRARRERTRTPRAETMSAPPAAQRAYQPHARPFARSTQR